MFNSHLFYGLLFQPNTIVRIFVTLKKTKYNPLIQNMTHYSSLELCFKNCPVCSTVAVDIKACLYHFITIEKHCLRNGFHGTKLQFSPWIMLHYNKSIFIIKSSQRQNVFQLYSSSSLKNKKRVSETFSHS